MAALRPLLLFSSERLLWPADVGRSVIERIKGVLGPTLSGFHVTIPSNASQVRLACSVSEHATHRETCSSPECAARVLKAPTASSGPARAVEHLADLRQVDFDPAQRLRGFDLVAAKRRVAEVDVQRGGQHLSLEHRVHGRTGSVRGFDDRVDVVADLRACRSGAQILEGCEGSEIRARLADTRD